jgi:hypothetical protein
MDEGREHFAEGVQVAAHGLLAAGVALGDDLPGQLGGLGDTAGPALMQVDLRSD